MKKGAPSRAAVAASGAALAGACTTSPRWFTSIALVGIAASLVLRYRWVCGMSWFNDDFLLLDRARHLELSSLLPSHDAIGNAWRPVSRAVWFGLGQRAFGDSAAAFHALNLGLACGSLVLFFLVVRRLLQPGGPDAGRSGADAPALVATALLSVHPAIGTLLAWAAGAQDLLAIALSLAALLATSHRRRGLATVCFALALLSKETAALVPLLMTLVAAVVEGTGIIRALRRTWASFAVAVLWLAVNPYMPWRTTPFGSSAASGTAAHTGGAVIATLRALVLLEPRAGFVWSLAPVETIASLLLLIAALALAARCSWPARIPGAVWALAVLWIAGFLLPLAATTSTPLYYAFGPAAGLSLAAAAGLASLREPRLRGPLAAVALLTFVAASGVTHADAQLDATMMHRASGRLWSYRHDLLRAHPVLPNGAACYFLNVPHNSGFQTADGPALRVWYANPSLRAYYLSAYEPTAAPTYFFACDSLRSTLTQIQLTPPDAAARQVADLYSYALTDLGTRFQEVGQDSLAETAWRAGLALRPDDPYLLLNLGELLVGRGLYSQAHPLLQRGLLHLPDDLGGHLALGFADARLGATAEARTQFAFVVDHGPGSREAEQATRFRAALRD